jgi:glycosyltransferase involved in cell wall biosynthesis
MKILIINQYFATRAGAGGNRGYEFARRFAARGDEVTILTTASDYGDFAGQRKFLRKTEIEGMRVVSVNIGYSQEMSAAQRIYSFLAFMVAACCLGVTGPRPDIVFATSTPLSVGIPGAIVAFIRRSSFVFEVRDLWPRAPIELGVIRNRVAIFLLRKIERWIYRRAERIVALSPGMAKGVEETGIDPARITVVPNGCDLDLFDSLPEKAVLRKELGMTDRFTLAYTGAIGPANHLDFLIDVVKAYGENADDELSIVIAGEGSDLGRLRLAASRLPSNPFRFLGRMPREEAIKHLAASDAGLTLFRDLPVLKTNSPNKFFDTLSAGIPAIINTPDGWIADLVESHNAGIVLPPDDPRAAAEMIRELAADPERAREKGNNARELAMEHFDRERLFSRLATVLDSALMKQAPR